MKHAKPSKTKKRVTAIAVGLGVSTAVPLVITAPQAHAVSMSEWDQIAQCESGGDWQINHSSDGLSVGGLQFQNPSWKAALDYLDSQGYNTSTWTQNLYQGMPRSAVPTKAQQVTAGEALLKLQPNPWLASSSCSGVYLKQSESVFNGGSGPGVDNFISAAESQGGTTPTPDPVPTPTPTPTPTPAPTPGHGHSHGRWWHHWTVAKGDTLWRVAVHAYGDGRQWPKVAKANPGVVANHPNLIHPNDYLYVP